MRERRRPIDRRASPSVDGNPCTLPAVVFILLLVHQNIPLSHAFVRPHPNHLFVPPKRQSNIFVATPHPKVSALADRSTERHPKDPSYNETYNFWDDNLSVASLNMDLENLAQEDPQKAADALDIMEKMHHQEPDNPFYVKPNAASYTVVIGGWVRFEALPSSTLVTHAPNEDSSLSSESLPFVQHPYNSNNNHHHFGAQQAQAWLDRLEAAYEASRDEDLKPNSVSYLLVCQKWADDYAQDFTGESAEKAERVLFKMRERADESGQSSCSKSDDVKVWSIVLEAWCKRAGKVRGAIKRAEDLLSKMEEQALQQEREQEQTNSTKTSMAATARPNIVTYTSYIGGLARSREGKSAKKAEEVLERMKTVGSIEPDMVAYTAVLNCYAKASSWKERNLAAKRALEILDFMEAQYIHEDKYFLKPNVITYSTAIKAIGNSLDQEAAAIAERVLRRMYTLHETGTIASCKPQTSTYNAVISALASHSRRIIRQRSHHHSTHSRIQQGIGLKNARKAEQLLVEMIKKARGGEKDVEPNVRTWGAVISTWAESGQPDAGGQAQRVLHTMKKLYARGESSVRPNFVCFTTAMAALGNSALASNDPDQVAKNLEAADKVEQILMTMEEEYEVSMDIDKRPNTISYITAIDSFCKLDEKNAANRAQRTVDRMMQLYAKGLGHVRPSRIVFNSLINAWSRCPNKGVAAAQAAEAIFQWMETQYRQAGNYIVKPDEVSLCGVLNAWANNAEHGGARRAQQILDKIESMTTKERGFQHTTICHNIAIKAWGRSKEPDAVQHAESILTRLEKQWDDNKDDTLKPDVTTYSSVINCCAYYSPKTGKIKDSPNNDESSGVLVDGRKEAFQVALRTFRKLCASKSAHPNNITYGTLFKAIANLAPMDDEREALTRTIFDQCCKEGQVDSFVLSQVRNASPNALYRELVLEPAGVDATLDYTENVNAILKRLPERWRRRPN